MKKAQGWFWDLPECQPRHLVTKVEAYSTLSSHGACISNDGFREEIK